MTSYSPRERIEIIIAGEKPDRYAASFWRHFYHKEHYAAGTAEAMLDFQKEFGWDFMKINPRAEYHVEDWGLKLDFSHHEFTKHTKTSFPINDPDDWLKIERLPMTAPVLAEHLKVVSLIRKGAGPDLPLLMTVFTPLAIAGRMVPDRKMIPDHIRKHPAKISSALRAITDTFREFVSELRNAGADGLFFATTHYASSDLLTWDEYEKFAVPYEREILAATEDDAMNLLHVCGSNNYLEQMKMLDYPVGIYNWDSSDPTNRPLDIGLDMLANKAVVGGVDHRGWLLRSEADEMAEQIRRLKSEFSNTRLIIGPGCSVAPEVSLDNLRAIREAL